MLDRRLRTSGEEETGMLNRSSTATVTFANAFTLAGYPDALPPGDYQVLTDEELLQGISFEAYRTTATYLVATRAGANSGRTELRATTAADIDAALERDRASTARNLASALPSPFGALRDNQPIEENGSWHA
jgi:hypothetical protein